MMKQIIKYCLIIILAQIPIYGQPLPIKTDSLIRQSSNSNTFSELQKDILQLIENPDFFNAHIGVSVVSVESGETIFRQNDTKNFIPASTQKVLTSSAALHFLGRDFRYTTSLYLDGELQSNGEFIGNVIIRGSGDPSLSKDFYENPLDIFDQWTYLLDSMGIKSIRGNIIGDDSYFDPTYYAQGWAWDDISFPYSAQVNGLNIFDNKVDIIVEPGDTLGALAKLTADPENSYTGLINNIQTIADSQFSEIYHKRELQSNIIELYGGIKPSGKKKNSTIVSVAIDNPTLFLLSLFKSTLERNHIRFRGALLDIDDWTQRINYSALNQVVEHSSPPLHEIISVLNKMSNNLIAEALLKTIAKEQTGRGTFSAGADQLAKFCVRNGIAPENIYLADGSGLSRHNLISPRYQTQLLSSIYRSSLKEDMLNSLAVPGENGTLKSRMTNSLAQNSVRAKTGSMNGVSTICGYVTTKDNETLAFSIMIMNHTVALNIALNLQDLICMRLASFSRKHR